MNYPYASLALSLGLLGMTMVSSCDSLRSRSPGYFQTTIGFSLQDEARSVFPTRDGGFVLCGLTNSLRGTQDVLVLKIDNNANVQWQKTFGGVGSDAGGAVTELSGGDFALVGRVFFSTGYDFYALRLDTRGALVWYQLIGSGKEGHAVQPTPDGGLVAAGTAGSDVALYRIDAAGRVAWIRVYARPLFDFGTGVLLAADDGFIVSGYTNRDSSTYQPFLMRVDGQGEEQWTRVIPVSSRTEIYCAIRAHDGGVLCAGRSGALPGTINATVIKTDANGNVEWNQSYGPASVNEIYGMCLATNGDYIVTGKTYLNTSGTDYQLLVMRIDRSGNEIWTRTYGGTEDEIGWGVQPHSGGGYLAVGSTRSFGSGSTDVYLLHMDENGHTKE